MFVWRTTWLLGRDVWSSWKLIVCIQGKRRSISCVVNTNKPDIGCIWINGTRGRIGGQVGGGSAAVCHRAVDCGAWFMLRALTIWWIGRCVASIVITTAISARWCVGVKSGGFAQGDALLWWWIGEWWRCDGCDRWDETVSHGLCMWCVNVPQQTHLRQDYPTARSYWGWRVKNSSSYKVFMVFSVAEASRGGVLFVTWELF